jgi:ABC-2 type transport system permease protein
VYAIPLLLVIAVVTGFVAGAPEVIPSSLGMLAATFGVGLGVILPISVRAAYALPDSTNPFAMSSGAGLTKGLMTFAGLFLAIIATLPLQLAAYLLGDLWLWLGLPLGLGYGAAAYLLGSRLAGDQVDRRMPELLATVSPHR